MAYSNRPFADTKELREGKAYREWQAYNRQVRQEATEYDEMKRVLGDKMPYTTLGGFRRAKRAFVELKNGEALDKTEKIEYNKFSQTQIAVKDEKLKADIRGGKYDLTVHEGKQGKHIKGHNNFIEGRSYLTVDEKEVQELVNKYAGTGEIRRDTNKKWKHTEVVNSENFVGYTVDQFTGEETKTTAFTIHYSKTGTHIVPQKGGEDDII